MISIVTSETITDGFHFPERAFKALSLKIEDLKEITKDPDVLNIIALREFIKDHNTIGYFNYQETRKEETDGE